MTLIAQTIGDKQCAVDRKPLFIVDDVVKPPHSSLIQKSMWLEHKLTKLNVHDCAPQKQTETRAVAVRGMSKQMDLMWNRDTTLQLLVMGGGYNVDILRTGGDFGS